MEDLNQLWKENERVRMSEALSRNDAKILEGVFNNFGREIGLEDGTLAGINYNSKEHKLFKESVARMIELKQNATEIFKKSILQ